MMPTPPLPSTAAQASSNSAERLDAPCTFAIVGVGLIGGSFAAAMRARGYADRILGVGRAPGALDRALDLGLIDAAVSAAEAARVADYILLATPVGATQQVLADMAPHLRDETCLTDAGSTKSDVILAARQALGARMRQFVPAHPIAGAEKSGPDAASPTLFEGRRIILTPVPENTPETVARVRRVWASTGGKVQDMAPESHDTVFASVSHLPHLLSAVYMSQVADSANAATRLAQAGTGFRDFTRIAAGSPEMWRDIFVANAASIRSELTQVRALLDQMDTALAQGDAQAMEQLLSHAAQARQAWEKDH